MKRVLFFAVSLLLLILVIGFDSIRAQASQQDTSSDQSRIKKGFKIAPVTLDLHNRNRALVGLGSYIVNGVSGCIDCHSCPSFAPGHNPYDGVGDGAYNATNYLAGGIDFGPG